jgi:hypothetical protein
MDNSVAKHQHDILTTESTKNMVRNSTRYPNDEWQATYDQPSCRRKMSTMRPVWHLNAPNHSMQRDKTHMGMDTKTSCKLFTSQHPGSERKLDMLPRLRNATSTKTQRHSLETGTHDRIYIYDNQTLPLQDYTDFMRRARWKEYQKHNGHQRCGKYLDVLDY